MEMSAVNIEAGQPGIRTIRISDKEFARLSDYIQMELGIKMPEAKKTLLESRLQKRLKALNLGSFTQYCEYVFGPGAVETELVHMIDLVTTNKTDFFRESHHFDYLSSSVLPELAEKGAGVKRPLSVWSAGCSTGEEPYTIAMVINSYAEKINSPYFDYSITSTDISTRVLESAKKAIYPEDRVTPVPHAFRAKYLLRSREAARGLVRIVPELRSKVNFRRLNFMDNEFGFSGQLDIIFCRNVIIYFNKETQLKLFEKFYGLLRPGGYLFIGHSETLNGFNLPLAKAATSVYQKPG